MKAIEISLVLYLRGRCSRWRGCSRGSRDQQPRVFAPSFTGTKSNAITARVHTFIYLRRATGFMFVL